MFKKTAAALAIVLASGVAAYAQTTQPATAPKTAPPAATAPATPPKAATTAAPVAPAKATAPAAQAKLVNVNTANADELDVLPQIGPARSKAIMENRVAAKGGAYKDIADLEKRANLPSNAIEAIKDKVRFK